MTELLISASILSADFGALGEAIRQAEAAGVDWIHIDVMDGHFVPNITVGPVIVEACRKITRLPLDVHLMIEQPERHIEAFARASHILTVHIAPPNITHPAANSGTAARRARHQPRNARRYWRWRRCWTWRW